MKTTVVQTPKEFQPVTISVTFETEKELKEWLKLRAETRCWIKPTKQSELFCRMFPATTTYFEIKKLNYD
jgi:hypothetical protein